MLIVKQGKNFVFTWNNPPPLMPPLLDGMSVIACEEYGDSETRHWQGYVNFKTTRTFAALKKWSPTAHWENRKGTSEDAYNYCIKGTVSETVTPLFYHDKYWNGDGVPIPGCNMLAPVSQGQRTDLNAAKLLIQSHARWSDVLNDPLLTDVVSKHLRWARDVHGAAPVTPQEGILRPWQQRLLDVVIEDPHPRRIYWFYDAVGNKGKSWMATYLGRNHGALVVSSGKTADIALVYDQHPIVVWDLSRCQMENVNYGPMEDIKNGRIFSPKYESRVKYFRVPHVIVFANFLCPDGKFSEDRLRVVNLGERHLFDGRSSVAAEEPISRCRSPDPYVSVSREIPSWTTHAASFLTPLSPPLISDEDFKEIYAKTYRPV